LITYNLEGEPAEFARAISADISSKCGVADPHRRIPPHATLKSPFQATRKQAGKLMSVLRAFTNDAQSGKVRIDRFGHFTERVLYLDLMPESSARQTVDSLTEILNKLEWLTLDEHDKHVLLHSTIARARSDAEFEQIWSYLQENYQPNLQMSFDNISVLKLDTANDQWHVDEAFTLQ
jgi:2'-5' RNA ligase